ncbi:ribonuclease H-like domain-containing protein [Tanacetum coccineum]|uniref:Ribonuclease H-like domain-containing protein n=1 Tax=Tanacetum coccineum TaxID=301880 RepID=A0ABQ5HJ91_9ASTR
MKDYALWEVIVNGDSPPPKSIVDGVEQTYPPTTTEEKLARKNELNAIGTLLIALPNEHQLKFNTYKCAKTLMESIEKSSTKETVNTTHSVSVASSKDQTSTASYDDDIDADDLEEMDLKWQVAMLTMRVKRFIKKTGRKLDLNGKETIGFDRTKVECYNCHRRGHFARECRAPRNQGNRNRDDPRRNAPVDTSTTNALVVQDGIGLSSSSSSDSEVHTCSKDCLKSYEALQKQYDQQREALNKSNLEIIGYQMGLESLEARIVVHEKNEAVYEEDIAFLKYDVQVKDISIKDLKNQLEEALKEKDDLKLKLEKFEESSKNLTKLINSQISAKDKTGLGYDSQMNESELNNIHMNESEVVHSVFNSRESDVDDSPVNDRFKIGKGFHAVPLPLFNRKIHCPTRPDLSFIGLDDSVYKTKVSETSISKTSKDIVEKPKTIRPSAPIIEDWDTDSDNDSMFRPKTDQIKPKFIKINFVKSDENVKSVNKENTHNAAVGYGENVVKSSASWIWRPTGNVIDHTSKDSGSYMLKRFDYVDLQGRLKSDQEIFDSGCSRHMTGNKSFLTDYQEVDGGIVAFSGSPKGVFFSPRLNVLFYLLDFKDLDVQRMKRIKREFSVARTPQQNGVAERKNKTLIEAARTMLADLLLPTTFWAKAVSTACYVQNRVLVTKPHNKTPYELLHGRPPSISFMRPFRCLVTILNTLDPLGKFDGKADEGFFVGYSINSKAFRLVTAGNQTSKNAELIRMLVTDDVVKKELMKNQQFEGEDMVYVDDIIFGLTKKSLCTEFESLMQEVPDEFYGRAHFLLRVAGHAEKMMESSAATEITPKVSHLHVVKRIFRYLKGQPKLGLWYPKDSPFDLEAFSDSVMWSKLDMKFPQQEKSQKDTEISQSSGPILIVTDETVIKEWEDRMEMAATTASSLEAKAATVVTLNRTNPW